MSTTCAAKGCDSAAVTNLYFTSKPTPACEYHVHDEDVEWEEDCEYRGLKWRDGTPFCLVHKDED